MNIANQITVSRLALTLLFIVTMSTHARFMESVSTLIFIAASISDYYDGKLARQYGIVTRFGQLVDPLVDKILISSAFIFFLTTPDLGIPAWAVIVIISREFIVTGMRLLAAGHGTTIAADSTGKKKTALQITTSIVTLLYLSAREINGAWHLDLLDQIDLWLRPVPMALVVVTALVTVYSGFLYGVKNREVLTKDLG